jgi:hypothetical protein
MKFKLTTCSERINQVVVNFSRWNRTSTFKLLLGEIEATKRRTRQFFYADCGQLRQQHTRTPAGGR